MSFLEQYADNLKGNAVDENIFSDGWLVFEKLLFYFVSKKDNSSSELDIDVIDEPSSSLGDDGFSPSEMSRIIRYQQFLHTRARSIVSRTCCQGLNATPQ